MRKEGLELKERLQDDLYNLKDYLREDRDIQSEHAWSPEGTIERMSYDLAQKKLVLISELLHMLY